MEITFRRVEFVYPPDPTIKYGFDARNETTGISVYGWEFDNHAPDDLEFLKQIVEYHNHHEEPAMIELFNLLWRLGKGCFIGENQYDWETIKSVIMDEEDGVTTLQMYVRDLR